MRLQQTFEIRHRPDAVKEARDAIREQMEDWGLPVDQDLVVLLVSEVVSNAIEHGTPPVTVRIVWDAAKVTISVRDAGVSSLPIASDADCNAESGRGLGMLEALADRWGVDVAEHTKTVWFQVGRRSSGGGEDRTAEPADSLAFGIDDYLLLWQGAVEPV